MKTMASILKTRLLGGTSTTSGLLGGIGSVPNVCHSLCMSLVTLLAGIGITINILPFMFLQTYQMYFWVAALVFTVASLYFYVQQNQKLARDRNLLFINSGLLIFGLPFFQLADYMDFFRFIGISLAVVGIFLFFFAKKFKTVYRLIHLGGVHSATPEVRPYVNQASIPAVSTIHLPKLTVSSALFALVVGGFLVNQYLMYRMGIFGNVNTLGTSTTTSAMKTQSRMKLAPFDVALARERMDKNQDGICDVCGMKVEQCIDTGQIDCNMGKNKDAIGVLGSAHIHADFKVYINGQVLDFSDKDHMGRMRNNLPVSSFIHVDSGSPAPEKTGDVLHMHATKVPLSLFFRSLGMNLTKDSLILTDGKILRDEHGNTLKWFVNGRKVDDLTNYVFQQYDKLLISYGPENDQDIERQIQSITNFAKNH